MKNQLAAQPSVLQSRGRVMTPSLLMTNTLGLAQVLPPRGLSGGGPAV